MPIYAWACVIIFFSFRHSLAHHNINYYGLTVIITPCCAWELWYMLTI